MRIPCVAAGMLVLLGACASSALAQGGGASHIDLFDVRAETIFTLGATAASRALFPHPFRG